MGGMNALTCDDQTPQFFLKNSLGGPGDDPASRMACGAAGVVTVSTVLTVNARSSCWIALFWDEALGLSLPSNLHRRTILPKSDSSLLGVYLRSFVSLVLGATVRHGTPLNMTGN